MRPVVHAIKALDQRRAWAQQMVCANARASFMLRACSFPRSDGERRGRGSRGVAYLYVLCCVWSVEGDLEECWNPLVVVFFAGKGGKGETSATSA